MSDPADRDALLEAMARAWLNWPPAMKVCAVPAWARRVAEGLATGKLKPDSRQDRAALAVMERWEGPGRPMVPDDGPVKPGAPDAVWNGIGWVRRSPVYDVTPASDATAYVGGPPRGLLSDDDDALWRKYAAVAAMPYRYDWQQIEIERIAKHLRDLGVPERNMPKPVERVHEGTPASDAGEVCPACGGTGHVLLHELPCPGCCPACRTEVRK